MKTPLVIGSLLLASAAAIGCSVGSDDASDNVEQGKKVEPSDETALLLVTLPSSFPIQSTNSVRLPGVPDEGRPSTYGSWSFDYVLGTDHLTVNPGTAIAVRPGGCLYTLFSSSRSTGYSILANKDCDLGLVAGAATTYALGAARVHFDTEPLRVDFGKNARPHLEDASGGNAYGVAGGQTFGGYPSYAELPSPVWTLNLQTTDVATGKPADYLAAPLRPGKYTLKFDIVGVSSKTVTVTAGTIVDVDATPKDVRSTVHFADDDPAPFQESALQILKLEVGGDDATAGYLPLDTGGFDAKFFPTGAASDSVGYVIDDASNGVMKSVSVARSGAANVVLSRIDVDDVAVNGGGAAQRVQGKWQLDWWNGKDWSNVNTCAHADPSSHRCTGGTSAYGLSTKSGLFVPDGKYRVTVRYKTDADPNEQTKTYDVSIP
jgi:hypothetical protein